jgi:hypothetical protein
MQKKSKQQLKTKEQQNSGTTWTVPGEETKNPRELCTLATTRSFLSLPGGPE